MFTISHWHNYTRKNLCNSESKSCVVSPKIAKSQNTWKTKLKYLTLHYSFKPNILLILYLLHCPFFTLITNSTIPNLIQGVTAALYFTLFRICCSLYKSTIESRLHRSECSHRLQRQKHNKNPASNHYHNVCSKSNTIYIREHSQMTSTAMGVGDGGYEKLTKG